MSIQYVLFGTQQPIQLESKQISFHADAESALEALTRQAVEQVVICNTQVVQAGKLPDLPDTAGQFDLLHAGLAMGADNIFKSLWLTGANWLFLNPDPGKRSVSWKASPALCYIRPELVNDLGGFDPAYASPDARLMDFGYRLLIHGGRVCHEPDWNFLAQKSGQVSQISIVDELIFIHRHLGTQAVRYATFWLSIMHRNPAGVWRANKLARQRLQKYPAPYPLISPGENAHLLEVTPHQQVGAVSAIIPTINRYEYIRESIDSLLKQAPPPSEIIIVDQTPPAHRQPDVYAPYLKEGIVKVIYLEQSGQSISRNTAIQAAQGEWCLLFEDDTVAWDDLMLQHVQAIELSGATASTGVSLAPWKTRDNIPAGNRHFRSSDVLASGNCLARRSALLGIGGLDRAFDHGSGADHDLGVRMYLAGYDILYNPHAIQTHYKAPRGGMRTYGAWWREHANFWDPFPQPTQIYTIQRYYPRSYWLPLYLLYYLRAKRQLRWGGYLWLWLTLPWKLTRALRRTTHLQHRLMSSGQSV